MRATGTSAGMCYFLMVWVERDASDGHSRRVPLCWLDKIGWGGGVTVGPQDTVELIGEVDKDFNKIEFDVDIVKKVN